MPAIDFHSSPSIPVNDPHSPHRSSSAVELSHVGIAPDVSQYRPRDLVDLRPDRFGFTSWMFGCEVLSIPPSPNGSDSCPSIGALSIDLAFHPLSLPTSDVFYRENLFRFN